MNILGDTQQISCIEFPFSYDSTNQSSLNYYLGKFIEPPKRNNMICILKKMYALNIFEIKGNKGYLTNLGLAISKLDRIDNLCLRKMLIMSYLNNCFEDIARFVSFAHSNECNFSELFIDIRREKDKLKKLDKRERKSLKKDLEESLPSMLIHMVILWELLNY